MSLLRTSTVEEKYEARGHALTTPLTQTVIWYKMNSPGNVFPRLRLVYFEGVHTPQCTFCRGGYLDVTWNWLPTSGTSGAIGPFFETVTGCWKLLIPLQQSREPRIFFVTWPWGCAATVMSASSCLEAPTCETSAEVEGYPCLGWFFGIHVCKKKSGISKCLAYGMWLYNPFPLLQNPPK